jgi:hypothetical protein
VNVLRDTHKALVPEGSLLDFHPVYPPWAQVEARGRVLGELREPEWPELVRQTEAGLDEVVKQGLFRAAAERTCEIAENYKDADELLAMYEAEVDEELRARLRETPGPVRVVQKLVFRLYRAVGERA